MFVVSGFSIRMTKFQLRKNVLYLCADAGDLQEA